MTTKLSHTDRDADDAADVASRIAAARREMGGCVCFSLRKAARVMTQVYDTALAGTGLRITQFSLLAMLRAHGGPRRISDLARDLVMDRTTLTRNLRPLERQGFVAISAGEDRRERLATITPEGEAAVASALPRWRAVQEQVMHLFGSERWLGIRGDINNALKKAVAETS